VLASRTGCLHRLGRGKDHEFLLSGNDLFHLETGENKRKELQVKLLVSDIGFSTVLYEPEEHWLSTQSAGEPPFGMAALT
jgi:hypothetical protein